METGLSGFNEIEPPGDADRRRRSARRCRAPTPDRLLVVAQACRAGLSDRGDPRRLQVRSLVPRARFARIVAAEARRSARSGLPQDAAGLRRLKALGFSDARLAELARRERERGGGAARPAAASIPSTSASTPAPPSSRRSRPTCTRPMKATAMARPSDEADPPSGDKVMILGGGPNRIGQGIEFDYCCVHAAYALKEAGIETIMVNCNPETVSTDYDTSDRLYFEPLTAEDVIELVRVEERRGELLGVIVQLGGQTPLKLAAGARGRRDPDPRHLARRHRPGRGPRALPGAAAAPGAAASRRTAPPRSAAEAETVAQRIGYPVVIRPSYVLGGRAMEIVHEPAGLARYMRERGQGLRQESGADRPLPPGRDRGRCRRARRRHDVSTSPASWSTSRRPASIPATAPARCRPTRCRPPSSPKSSADRRHSPARSASSG